MLLYVIIYLQEKKKCLHIDILKGRNEFKTESSEGLGLHLTCVNVRLLLSLWCNADRQIYSTCVWKGVVFAEHNFEYGSGWLTQYQQLVAAVGQCNVVN